MLSLFLQDQSFKEVKLWFRILADMSSGSSHVGFYCSDTRFLQGNHPQKIVKCSPSRG